MNAALPKRVFDRLSLVSLLDTMTRLQSRPWTAVVRNRMPGGV